MTATTGVSTGGQRIDSLDVLRGFAILGILVMNVQMFSMVTVAYVNPTLAGPMVGVDYWLWLLTHVGFENKFLAIFAALFGAGIVLLSERAEAAGRGGWYWHLRRMGVLALIGAVHAYFIWYGDILLVYALIGAIAFAFRKLPPRTLLLIAGVVYLVPFALSVVLTIVFINLPETYYQLLVTRYWQPVSPEFVVEEAAYRGGWLDQMEARVESARMFHLWMLPTKHGWNVLAMMLAGMAAYRTGLLTGDWPARTYARWAAFGLAVGLPLAGLGVWFNEATGWEMATSLFLGAEFNELAAPFIALAWICGMLLVLRRGGLGWIMARLRTIGRTALSCYLLTSILCTAVFYGHGLGLFGRLSRPEQLIVVVLVWMALIAFASVWLRYFRMGPVEWAWRWAASGQRPLLLRVAG